MERQDTEYPDTDAVIPKQGKESDQFKVFIRGHKEDILSISSALITLYKRTGNGYAGHLIERLTPAGGSWTASNKGKDKPIRLDCADLGENITAVIMPFKMEE